MKRLATVGHGESGFGLPMVLSSLVAVAVVGGACAAYMSQSLATARNNSLKDAAKLAIIRIQGVVNNDATWAAITLKNKYNPATGMSCIYDNSCCSLAAASITAAVTLYDQDGSLLYDPNDPNSGFSLSGVPCPVAATGYPESLRDARYPSEQCPVKPMIYWRPRPADPSDPYCKRAQLTISFEQKKSLIQINDQTGTDSTGTDFAKARSGALAGIQTQFNRGEVSGSIAEYCENLGGFFDSRQGQCVLKAGMGDTQHMTQIDCASRSGSWTANPDTPGIGTCALSIPDASSCAAQNGRWDYSTGNCLLNNHKCADAIPIASFDTTRGSFTCDTKQISVLAPTADAMQPCAPIVVGPSTITLALIGVAISQQAGTTARSCSMVPTLPDQTGSCPTPGTHLQTYGSTYGGAVPIGTKFCNWDTWPCQPGDLDANTKNATSTWDPAKQAFGACLPSSSADCNPPAVFSGGACVIKCTTPGQSLVNGTCQSSILNTSITWADLQKYQPACALTSSVSDVCLSAINRYCQNLGYASGFGPIEQVTTNISIACVANDAGAVLHTTFTNTIAAIAPDTGCDPANPMSQACAAGLSRQCAAQGSVSGWGPVEHLGDVAFGLCMSPGHATIKTTNYTELATYHPACNDNNLRYTAGCFSAVSRYCQANGFTSGYGPVEANATTAIVTCVN